MDNQDALAQLKDIHFPTPVGWWPIAPGWYLLGFFLLILTMGLSYILYKKRESTKPKLRALALLASYKQQYERDKNSQMTSSQVSELLRRVALVYFPREQVASLHGESWLEFLDQTGKEIDFISVKSMLLDLPFKPSELVNLDPLFSKVELWIKQRVTPCSN